MQGIGRRCVLVVHKQADNAMSLAVASFIPSSQGELPVQGTSLAEQAGVGAGCEEFRRGMNLVVCYLATESACAIARGVLPAVTVFFKHGKAAGDTY